MRRLYVVLPLIICCLIFAENGFSAEKWSHFATDEDGVRHYYDEGSVKWTAANTVQGWDKWDLSGEDRGEFRRDTGREAGYVKSRVEIRCKSREHRSVKIVYFGPKGDEILSFDDTAASWEEIIPGSVMDLLHNTLCVDGTLAI